MTGIDRRKQQIPKSREEWTSMQSDFLAKVHTMYNQFTKAEKKVADFILQNPKRVLFMSITELADECKVGDYGTRIGDTGNLPVESRLF